MILNYIKLDHDELDKYKKKDLNIKVFKPKEFENYRKEMEDNGKTVAVVRNTKLKKLKDNSDDVENNEYLDIDGTKYKVTKEKSHNAIAYIPVSETEFVRLESNLLLIILLFLILASLFILMFSCFYKTDNLPQELPDIEMDTEAGQWDGEGNKTKEDSEASQESIVIPGFSTFKASSTANLIKLYNVPENTVNFVYTIIKPISEEQVKVCNDSNETQTFITEHQKIYQNYYDEANDEYKAKDENVNITDTIVEYKAYSEDGKYIINKYEAEVIYFTKGIAPDQSINLNVYELLGVGEHKLQFKISTYDVESNAVCYGAVQDVVITVTE